MKSRSHLWLSAQSLLSLGLAALLVLLAYRAVAVVEQAAADKANTLLRTVARAIHGVVRHGPDQEGRVYGVLEEVANDPDVLAIGIKDEQGRPIVVRGAAQPIARDDFIPDSLRVVGEKLFAAVTFEIPEGCMAPGMCTCDAGACHCGPHQSWAVPPGEYQLVIVMESGALSRVRWAVIGVTSLGLAILAALWGLSFALVRSLAVRETLARRVALEEERGERLASLSQLAAGLAHEIRNPLGAIRGYLQLLHEAGEMPDMAARTELMLRELDRVGERLEEFLVFARKRSVPTAAVDLLELARRVATLLQPDAEAEGVELTVTAPDDGDEALQVLGDPKALQELLLNLVLNAVEACRAGGRVAIRATRCEGGAELAVVDSGHGIAEAHLPHLFDPYFTTKDRGSGLGLAIAKRVAEDHEAELTVLNHRDGGVIARLRFC
jgi:signal transduction histidine kinase